MTLPPKNCEEESCPSQDSHNMIHNAIERRRKVKINNYIANLAKVLPNKNGRKWGTNETFKKAVEYILEIKQAHEKMLIGKVDEVHAIELGRLRRRIDELEMKTSKYEKRMRFAGTSSSSSNDDTRDISKQPSDLTEKIDHDCVLIGVKSEILMLSPPLSIVSSTKTDSGNEESKTVQERTPSPYTTDEEPIKKKMRLATDTPTDTPKIREITTPMATTNSGMVEFQKTNTSTATSAMLIGGGSSSKCGVVTASIANNNACQTSVTKALPCGPIMSATIATEFSIHDFGATMTCQTSDISERDIPVQQKSLQKSQLANAQMTINGIQSNAHINLTPSFDCQPRQTHLRQPTYAEEVRRHPNVSASDETSRAGRQNYDTSNKVIDSVSRHSYRTMAPAGLSSKDTAQQINSISKMNRSFISHDNLANSDQLLSTSILGNPEMITGVVEPLIYRAETSVGDNLLSTADFRANDLKKINQSPATVIVLRHQQQCYENQISEFPSNVQEISTTTSKVEENSSENMSEKLESKNKQLIKDTVATAAAEQINELKLVETSLAKLVKTRPKTTKVMMEMSAVTISNNMVGLHQNTDKNTGNNGSPAEICSMEALSVAEEEEKQQQQKRPETDVNSCLVPIVKDILAQATESIFATSCTDGLSPIPGDGADDDHDACGGPYNSEFVRSSKNNPVPAKTIDDYKNENDGFEVRNEEEGVINSNVESQLLDRQQRIDHAIISMDNTSDDTNGFKASSDVAAKVKLNNFSVYNVACDTKGGENFEQHSYANVEARFGSLPFKSTDSLSGISSLRRDTSVNSKKSSNQHTNSPLLNSPTSNSGLGLGNDCDRNLSPARPNAFLMPSKNFNATEPVHMNDLHNNNHPHPQYNYLDSAAHFQQNKSSSLVITDFPVQDDSHKIFANYHTMNKSRHDQHQQQILKQHTNHHNVPNQVVANAPDFQLQTSSGSNNTNKNDNYDNNHAPRFSQHAYAMQLSHPTNYNTVRLDGRLPNYSEIDANKGNPSYIRHHLSMANGNMPQQQQQQQQQQSYQRNNLMMSPHEVQIPVSGMHATCVPTFSDGNSGINGSSVNGDNYPRSHQSAANYATMHSINHSVQGAVFNNGNTVRSPKTIENSILSSKSEMARMHGYQQQGYSQIHHSKHYATYAGRTTLTTRPGPSAGPSTISTVHPSSVDTRMIDQNGRESNFRHMEFPSNLTKQMHQQQQQELLLQQQQQQLQRQHHIHPLSYSTESLLSPRDGADEMLQNHHQTTKTDHPKSQIVEIPVTSHNQMRMLSAQSSEMFSYFQMPTGSYNQMQAPFSMPTPTSSYQLPPTVNVQSNGNREHANSSDTRGNLSFNQIQHQRPNVTNKSHAHTHPNSHQKLYENQLQQFKGGVIAVGQQSKDELNFNQRHNISSYSNLNATEAGLSSSNLAASPMNDGRRLHFQQPHYHPRCDYSMSSVVNNHSLQNQSTNIQGKIVENKPTFVRTNNAFNENVNAPIIPVVNSFADEVLPYQGHTMQTSTINAQVSSTREHKGSTTQNDGITAVKLSKSKQTSNKKKHIHLQQQQQQREYGQYDQYDREEVNLSNSIFETHRNVPPYFVGSNTFSSGNQASDYIPNTDPLLLDTTKMTSPQRGSINVLDSSLLDPAIGQRPIVEEPIAAKHGKPEFRHNFQQPEQSLIVNQVDQRISGNNSGKSNTIGPSLHHAMNPPLLNSNFNNYFPDNSSMRDYYQMTTNPPYNKHCESQPSPNLHTSNFISGSSPTTRIAQSIMYRHNERPISPINHHHHHQHHHNNSE